MVGKKKLFIDVKPNIYIYIALLLFLIPLKWLLAWFLAAGFHEACHYLAVKLCGGEIYSITIGISGAKMECTSMSKKRRLLCVLSGPAGGLLLIISGRWLPRVAICSWLLSFYNLMPLLSLDGGRALEILIGSKAITVQQIFLFLLGSGAFYLFLIQNFGLLPLGIVLILWLKNRNNPCKPGICKVQ